MNCEITNPRIGRVFELPGQSFEEIEGERIESTGRNEHRWSH